MSFRSRAFLALVPLLSAGCAKDGGAASAPAPAGWRSVATVADRDRMRDWRTAWMKALAQAKAAGHAEAIRAEGALLQPDAALADPAPPPGPYRCRITKLGAKGPGLLDYVAYPAFACRVSTEGDMLSLAKIDGSQRPVGLLFPADAQRLVFLGTLMLSDERAAQQYGRDPERDMAGALERIGPRRWRLVLPYPHFESTLDVMELMPAG